ncbi:MAG TPA: rod shape-determining protein MreD [Acidimicrobiia bacterium]|jgi:rod shape-determining protein MreD
MRGARPVLLTLGLAIVALVIQATLFRRFHWLVPDLVVLVVILSSLTLRPEAALLAGFLAGAVVDVSLGSSLLGLRALTYTVVAFLASRSRQRADAGPLAVAVWAGGLTLAAVTVLLLVGLLFGQSAELGGQMLRRLILVPLSNALLAALLAGPLTRSLERAARRAA